MINRVVKSRAVGASTRCRAFPKAKVAGAVVAAPVVVAAPALAEEVTTSAPPVEVDATIQAIVDAVQSAGAVVKSGVTTANSAVETAKQGYEVASPYIKQAVDFATPYAKQAATAVTAAAQSAVPVINDAVMSSGLPVKETLKTVSDTATTISATATPYITKATTTISTTEPVVLAEAGLGLAVLAVIIPGMLESMKGYAGDVTAATAQNQIVSGGAVLVDIRTTKEKESSGLPDLPSSAGSRVFEVEFAATADKKLRGALKDAFGIEVQVTALQIASLKKVGKGTTVILMDKNGGQASAIAKELTRKGFSKVFVLTGGFDGGNGWVASKLQIKPAAAAPSGFGSLGTTFTTKKALPAAK